MQQNATEYSKLRPSKDDIYTASLLRSPAYRERKAGCWQECGHTQFYDSGSVTVSMAVWANWVVTILS